MPEYTFQQFVEEWERASLKEKASAQSHFESLCRVLGHPLPHEQDPTGESFTYEYGVQKSGGGQGYADVWYKGHFAIEYKGKGKYNNLDEAYQQLLRYREALQNPPLLVVCDVERWEIHTNWPDTVKKVYKFTNKEILFPENQRILWALFYEPAALHPNRSTEDITREAADLFHQIAEEIRPGHDPDTLARFLIRLMFCLFAEDANLLPTVPGGDNPLPVFSTIVRESLTDPDLFAPYTEQLFKAMADGGHFFLRKIRYFDGAMFEDTRVLPLSHRALETLWRACQLNWASVEPAIFGTLFERVLDPAKRSQLGAHYTSEADIRLIVEPVLMQPFRREWAAVQAEAAPLRAAYDAAQSTREKQALQAQLIALRDRMLRPLREVRVLDPACGSGNFLYVALQLLKDLEKEVFTCDYWNDLSGGFDAFQMEVHPRQFYGIEKEPIAHALASVVVWIGYIQWNLRNGVFRLKEPIMQAIQNIAEKDAILAYDADGNPVEPEWPEADVIVSNPPFLGGKRQRAELGDKYLNDLFALYEGRVPHEADLVCYWYEKARTQIEAGKARRAGLLATNSIRGGPNRKVLERIKQTGNIFWAWGDREWVLDGAAVRISMVGFDDGSQKEYLLDGAPVNQINSDLQNTIDATQARRLPETFNIVYMGVTPAGPFDMSGEQARVMLEAPLNANGRPNADVVRPYYNAVDLVQRPRDVWTVDFGTDMTETEAAQYQMPFEYVKKNVYPVRSKNRRQAYRERWWLYAESRPAMRAALKPLTRYIATPLVSKHRIFVWLSPDIVPANLINVIARDDDYFFGVLHSRLHEVWSLRLGTSLEDRPRYTPTTTFETFPFPWPPGKEDTDSPAYKAVSAAARQLHEERDAWLNPPEFQGRDARSLERRTLTNLYNALQVFRGQASGKVERDAGDFAPRLDALHRALDEAVCAAYGWDAAILQDEEALLRALLALNVQRAGG